MILLNFLRILLNGGDASDIAPLYTSNVLFGFQQALAAGRTFDWESVLDLCEIVSRTQEETPETGGPPDLEPGYWQTTYASSRKIVALLIETDLTRDDVAIPDELLHRSRDILFLLTDDINPSTEYEHQWGVESPLGVRDLAPNVIRGRAIQALIMYSARAAKIEALEQPTESGSSSLAARRLEPEVKEKFTIKLDNDSSLAVRYLFGQFVPLLHYLDEEWLIAKLENIFPRQSEQLAYWEAAYEGYFSNNRFDPRIFEILRPYYQYAIERLLADDRLGIATDLANAGLIKHLENVYCDGIEDIEDNASLIKLFFRIAPDLMRARFVTGLQYRLKETDLNEATDQWLRAKLLLDVRAAELRKNIENQTLNQVVEELKTFVVVY